VRHYSWRRLAVVAALVLTPALIAACGSGSVRAGAEPTSSVVEPASNPGAAKPGTARPATAEPSSPAGNVNPPGAAAPRPVAPRPAPPRPSDCLGAVVHDVDASETGEPWPNLCIAVGGVLRLVNLGPGSLAESPTGLVSCQYAGGVQTCRLIQTGRVDFTITNAQQVRPLTLVVARAAVPPGPSPACLDAGYTIDGRDGGPPWWAICMKVGTVLRIEHLGPEGLAVSPASGVACRYEAAIHDCRLTRAMTVTFAVTTEHEVRTQIVVAIR
jgi:hypothetical protein